MKCYIKENSFIAKFAAWKLGTNNVAIVIGKTIYLHNTTKGEFLTNTRWLRHEVAHLRQCNDFGSAVFIIMYLIESIRNGYKNNKFEIEARAAEDDEHICDDMIITW